MEFMITMIIIGAIGGGIGAFYATGGNTAGSFYLEEKVRRSNCKNRWDY